FEQNSKDMRILQQSPKKTDKSEDIIKPNVEVKNRDDLKDNSIVENIEQQAADSASDPAIAKLAQGYRSCLRYFLPPSWTMNQDEVSNLGVQELCEFPLDSFLDHYEKGLRKLVGNYQNQAESKTKEADDSKAKLSGVRKMIAKLLKSINE
ncbi:ATPase MORC2A-like, partial [Saccoglossus kowalevskii]